MITILICFLFPCVIGTTIAQNGPFVLYNPIHLGIGIIGGINIHGTNGTLRCIGDPACPTYTGGTGAQFGVQTSIEWMPTDWGMRGSLGYAINSVSMSITDDRAKVKDLNGTIVPLIREHQVSASLNSLLLDLGVQKSFGNSRVFLGPNFGLLLNPSWKSTSTILSPGNIAFPSGKRDTVFIDEVIPSVNALQFGFGFGYGHHIPMSTSMVLTPEISFSIPFSQIVSAPNWKQTSINVGLSLRFGMGAVKEEVLRRAEIIDTIEVQVNERIGSLLIEGQKKSTRTIEELETHIIVTETIVRTDTLKQGLPPKQSPKPALKVFASKDESSTELDRITIHGQLVTEAFPILPMVFFSESESALDQRYRQLRTIEGFSSEHLEPLVSEQHKDILNIIGERMNRNIQSTVTLTGYSDPVTEKSDCLLAGKRIETVREYLVQVWNIDKSRISLNSDKRSCAPENPTMSRNEMGYAENRRIEISSDNKDILAPVIRSRYVELTEYDPRVVFLNTIGSIGEQILYWKTSTQCGDTTIQSEDGAELPEWVEMPISKEQARTMQQSTNSEAHISLIVQDAEAETGSAETNVPIYRDTTNFAIQRLSLMHFPVQKATLDRQGRIAIDAFLKDLEDNATITIIGYSDNLGNAQSNIELSRARAEAVYTYIRGVKPKSNIKKVDGVGSTMLPPGILSHALPESRFLSRTVQIEIMRTWK